MVASNNPNPEELTEEEKAELWGLISQAVEDAAVTSAQEISITFKGVTYTLDEAIAAVGDAYDDQQNETQQNSIVYVMDIDSDYEEVLGSLTASYDSYVDYLAIQESNIINKVVSAGQDILDTLFDENKTLMESFVDGVGAVMEPLADAAMEMMAPVVSGMVDFGAKLAGRLMEGIIGSMDTVEEDILPVMKETLAELEQQPDLPELQKNLIREVSKEGGGAWQGIVALMLGSFVLWTALGAMFAPLSKVISMRTDREVHSARLPEALIRELMLRGEITTERAAQIYGDLGWSAEDVEGLVKLYESIPPLADMVRFADFSSFDPEVIAKWREFYNAPEWIREPFRLVGIFGEWANKYWFSHWRQPGRYELEEMFWRRIINEESVRLAYRTQGYSAFWQDAFIDKIYTPFTRVDIRRMWDVGVLDDEETVLAYQDIGYSPEAARQLLIFTKLYQRLPDLRTRFSNGWITQGELLAALVEMGLSEERAQWELETLIDAVKPERVATERDLSKTEVCRALKLGFIDREEAQAKLLAMMYDAEEVNLILDAYLYQQEVEVKETERVLGKADILKAFGIGYINKEQVISMLEAIGYSSFDAKFIADIHTPIQKPERVAKERDLTKAEIYKGVKKELITWDEGAELLMDLGYDQFEATYILALNVAVLEGSPESFLEFKKLTQDYRKAQGLEAKEIPVEVIKTAQELETLRHELKEATERQAPESEVYALQARQAQLEYRLTELKAQHGL